MLSSFWFWNFWALEVYNINLINVTQNSNLTYKHKMITLKFPQKNVLGFEPDTWSQELRFQLKFQAFYLAFESNFQS